MPALRIENLSSGYGPLTVVRDIDLVVEPGDVLAILGANGVGKSTLLRTLAGLLPLKSGRIEFDGEDVSRLTAPTRVRKGIALVPEGRMLFPALSVYDHLWLGSNPSPTTANGLKERMARLFALFPALKPRLSSTASTLSGGQQQMLAIARALMSVPRFLLLDEPSMGVAPKLREEIYRALRLLIETTQLSVVVVEQDAALALGVARNVAIMQGGQLVRHASAQEVLGMGSIADFYLGQVQ